jgi:hypothetical protein
VDIHESQAKLEFLYTPHALDIPGLASRI